MPNPKRKHTRSRRDSRRSQNWKLERPSLSPCPNPDCKKMRPAHTVCPHCGFYKGRIAVMPKVEKAKPQNEGEAGS
jgi:large subunit ribosomal protein L32